MLGSLTLMMDWLADHGGWLGEAKEAVGAFQMGITTKDMWHGCWGWLLVG
jgi:hypothetical protein